MDRSLVDSLFVFVASLFVFLMHPGFAFVESGLCRKKNAAMVLLKNVAVVALGSIAYYAVGFGLMFGGDHPFVGTSAFAPGANLTVAAVPPNLPLYVFLFFQLVFAATAASIVSGAVAERMRLGAFFVFTTVAAGVIYPIVGHWVWGGGLLAAHGFHDFAGSTVVHLTGGAMALTGAAMVGPRLGKFDRLGRPKPLHPHSLPLAALGGLLLWVGWFGFNGGSALAFDPPLVARVVLVTNLAASAGFLVALARVRQKTRLLDFSMALNGALAGLVAITAGCDVIGPLESLVVGALAGLGVVELVMLVDRLRVDDPVGAVSVHFGAGVFGTLAVGVFADSGELKGLLHGGGVGLLGAQALGAGVVAAFATTSSALVWLALRASPLGLRVSPEEELEGLDLADCGLPAYGEDVPGHAAEEPPRNDTMAVPALSQPPPAPTIGR